MPVRLAGGAGVEGGRKLLPENQLPTVVDIPPTEHIKNLPKITLSEMCFFSRDVHFPTFRRVPLRTFNKVFNPPEEPCITPKGKMPENRAGGLIVRERSEESGDKKFKQQAFALRERSLFPTSLLSRQTEGFGLVSLPQS